MPGKSTCQFWIDGLTETYSKQQRAKLKRELESDGEAPADLNEMAV